MGDMPTEQANQRLMDPSVPRRWRTVSLRTLVIVIPVLVSLVLLQYARAIRETDRIRRVDQATRKSIQIIEDAGGTMRLSTFTHRLGWRLVWRWQVEQVTVHDVSFANAMGGQPAAALSGFPRSPELFRALRMLPYEIKLEVQGTDFGDEDLRMLQGAHFRALIASNTLLSNKVPDGPCPSELYDIDVTNTKIGDNFVRWASSHGNLVYVDVSHTLVTDKVVDCLESNRRLHSVSIRGNQLSPSSIERLRARGLLKPR